MFVFHIQHLSPSSSQEGQRGSSEDAGSEKGTSQQNTGATRRALTICRLKSLLCDVQTRQHVSRCPSLLLQTSSPPPSSPPPQPSEEAGSTPEVATHQLNGSSAASTIGQPLELASLAQPIPCALASRDNQSEGVEVEAPCCLDDCPSDGALQKEE